MAANSERAKEAIHRARTRLLSSHPFYGYLACRFKLREDNDQPTMATDGIHLFYNADFTANLTKPQIVAAIAHEVEHTYLKHISRGMDLVKDEEMWPVAQVAMDFAINPHLKDAGFELMQGAIFPEQQYWKDSFEQHWTRIKKSVKKIKLPQLCGTGDGGEGGKEKGKGGKDKGSCSGVRRMKGKDGKDATPAERAVHEAEIQTEIMNAASFARKAGKLPADIERMIQDLRAPKVSWKDVLRRFMQAAAKNDYRMTPPNRRHIHAGMYLPSLRSEAVESVLLVIDGSGSTWPVFPQFISEFASILLDVVPQSLHVMVWDTRCTWFQEFGEFSDETHSSLAALQKDMGAGGGSVFTECFNYYAEQTGNTPQVAIVLTDMEIYFPEDPGYPTLWIATEDIDGPFGETVRIEPEVG